MTPEAWVSTLAYRPGWTFHLKRRDDGVRLLVDAHCVDSTAPHRMRTTRHGWTVPADAFADERTFARWVFDRLLQAEWHEAAEFFQFAGIRPFFPNHSTGDPYEPVERWSDP